MKNWETYYLYYEGHADRVLKEIVHPVIEDIQYKLKKTVKFFFYSLFRKWLSYPFKTSFYLPKKFHCFILCLLIIYQIPI